jgi:hypothetical protein
MQNEHIVWAYGEREDGAGTQELEADKATLKARLRESGLVFSEAH